MQARNLTDTRQAYEALREVNGDLARRFAGFMAWRRRGERDYLYRIQGKSEKSLGPRSPETEAAEAAFREGKARAEAARKARLERVTTLARVNAALGLGRVPFMPARIISGLDELGLLGDHVMVVGTHAIFAYEAAAAVHIGGELLATEDVDFALDARRSLALVGSLMPSGLLGALRRVDPTFDIRADGDFRATNREGFMVDLITSAPKDPLLSVPRSKRRLSAEGEDMQAAELAKLQWLVEAPRFQAVAIAQNGAPLRMVVADPRFFAAHKLWLSSLAERNPAKRGRDRQQGDTIAALLSGPLSYLPTDDSSLSQLPPRLRDALRAAIERNALPPPALL